MNNLLNKIEKTKKVDLNKELRIKNLSEQEALLLSTYISLNNIDLIRESNEVNKSDAEVSQVAKDYLKELKNRESIDSIYDKYINIAILQVIKNIKYGYSFIELVNESYLYVSYFITTYYEKLKQKYDDSVIEEIFAIYCSVKLLNFQISQENEEFSSKISILAYLKIKDEINEGKNLEDILQEKGLDEDYYYTLENMYEDIEIGDMENIIEYTNNVKDEYEEYSKMFLFDYMEENVLANYLSLNGKKNKKLDILNNLNLNEKDFYEIFENVLKKISEVEEI